MDNWLPAHRKADGANAPYVMGYHTREDIPFQFALAEAFTVCDAYHCSVLGPTWPNRMYLDDRHDRPRRRTAAARCIGNDAPRAASAGPPTRSGSSEAGVSWKVYQQDDNYGCNVLEQFAAFRRPRRGSALYDRGLRAATRRARSSTTRINDQLPTVSWVIPHELPVRAPATTCRRRAPTSSPARSTRSRPTRTSGRRPSFILNYDENDGLFDHVAPPVPPPGTPGEFVRRPARSAAASACPCIIVSPWTAGGWVCSRALRPHVGAAVPGAGHRGAGAEHLGVAAAHLRRPDLGVPVRRRPGARSAHGAARAGGDPAVGQRVGHLACRVATPAAAARRRPTAPASGNGHAAAGLSVQSNYGSKRWPLIWCGSRPCSMAWRSQRRVGTSSGTARGWTSRRAGARAPRSCSRGCWPRRRGAARGGCGCTTGWCREPRLTHRWPLAEAPPDLAAMARELSARYGVEFTQVGANLYRDGADSVAWHGDRVARELPTAVVALVSLGATRPFRLRPTGGGPSVGSPRAGRPARDGRHVPAHLAAHRAEEPRRRAAHQRAVPPRLRGVTH